jgi:hypothetical protein
VAGVSTSFISREISQASFSNFPILIPMHGERRRKGAGHRCHECTRAHCPGRLGFGLANRIADGIICINMIHISPWEGRLGLTNGVPRPCIRRRRSISMVRTYTKE